MSQADRITGFLQCLRDEHPKIRASMVAKKGLEGLIMFPQSFKEEVSNVWEPLSGSIDDILTLVGRYSGFGQMRIYSEILGFGVFYLPLPMSDTALVVFVTGEDPLKESFDILPAMEETRKKIIEL